MSRRRRGVSPSLLRFITDFADAAVVLPLVAVVWALLGRWGTRWAVAVALTLGAMAGLKVLSFATVGAFSPSGHTASAAIVYGGLAWVLLRPAWGRVVPGLLAVAGVAAIGWTRLALAAHSPLEVLVGAAVGCAGLVALGQVSSRLSPASARRCRAAMAVPVVWVLFHGHSIDLEGRLRGLAGW